MSDISMSDSELLKFAIENGMLNPTLVQDMIEMRKREELLDKHPYAIWKGADDGQNNIRTITEDKLEIFIKTTIHEKQLTSKAYSGLRTLIIGIFKYAKKQN